jgi:predicted TIM-barrel fold metal-dependent hydrolase
MIPRRVVLQTALTAGAASVLTTRLARAADQSESRLEIIDTNVSLFRWPFRRLPLDDCQALLTKLRALGIMQAWAGSFEGLLQRDVAGVNARLSQACQPHRELLPVGTINLQLPGWEADLRQCLDQRDMPAIRLHPNYHGYTLADPRFPQLLNLATKAGRVVQVAAALEDTRTQHPLVRVPDLNLAPLADVMRRIAGAKVQILNARLRGASLDSLANTPGVYLDTARVEGTDGVANLLASVPPQRVLFGSHAPFLIPEAALIRVHESNLSEDSLAAVLGQNAKQISNSVTVRE